MATLFALLLSLGLLARVLKQVSPALLGIHAEKVAQVETGLLLGVVLEARALFLDEHFAGLLRAALQFLGLLD